MKMEPYVIPFIILIILSSIVVCAFILELIQIFKRKLK